METLRSGLKIEDIMIENNNSLEEDLQTGVEPVRKKKKSKPFLYGIMTGIWISIILYALGSIVGWAVGRFKAVGQSTFADGDESEVVDAFTTRKMMTIEDVIDQYYLEEADEESMENGIYSGMIASLGDPYSAYYSAEELKEMEQDVEGIYYGIGAYIGTDTDTQMPVISGIIEDTPAQEADLRSGDIIYMVDGVSTQGMETTDVVSLIKGEENTVVHLTLIRSGETDYIEVDVTRKKVESPTVNYEMLDDNIGYIQITEFDKVTTDQFADALAVCKGSGMTSLVLDLRSNPGGSLSVVCDIARMILPKGLIVYTEDKYGQKEEFTCDGSHELQVPMVVLVNDYSASASEILAGAIQDHEKGILMGTTTFGKGIVQRVISLSDGSAVKLTISTYFTPNGKNIHGKGIEPDEVVEFDADQYYDKDIDNQLEAAIAYLKK